MVAVTIRTDTVRNTEKQLTFKIECKRLSADRFTMLGEHRWWVFETTTLQSDGTRGVTSFQCGKGPDHIASFRPIKFECRSRNKLDDSERMDPPFPQKCEKNSDDAFMPSRSQCSSSRLCTIDKLYMNVNVQRFRTVRVHTHTKREIHNSTTYMYKFVHNLVLWHAWLLQLQHMA